MYICTENYSERDYRTIGITTEIINKALNSEFRAFLHSNQNDARTITHQCLKGSCNEPLLI